MGSVSAEKPHAVLVPFPAQGHITPMLKLAKLLHSKGFHITFVNTEYNHRRLLRSHGPDSVVGPEGFRFDTIPDGLPPSDTDATQDVPSLCASIAKNCLGPFRSLVARLNETPGVPSVTCIVSDACMSFALDAAKELGIPDLVFSTASACSFMAYVHCEELVSRGLVPLKSTNDLCNGFLDTPIDFIPGMNNMRLKDMPTFIRTTDPNDSMLQGILHECKRMLSMGSAIILNTFDALERDVLDAFPSLGHPPLYTVGPLHLLTRELPCGSPAATLNSNLWKEETSVTGWLEGKAHASVVYVNFGSITVMTNEQLVEFAWGLANSGTDFLWVIRPDLVRGADVVLPREFVEATKERGLLASWCAQEMVLAHPAVGGFLTHCGWNSTVESLSAGVPMICWPFFADQQTNCRYMCHEWGVGAEIGCDVGRGEVEGLIRDVIRGEKGTEMRRKALEWKESAEKAAEAGGSSLENLERVIKEVLMQNKKI